MQVSINKDTYLLKQPITVVIHLFAYMMKPLCAKFW